MRNRIDPRMIAKRPKHWAATSLSCFMLLYLRMRQNIINFFYLFSLTTSLQVGAMEFWTKIKDFYMSPIVRFVYHTVSQPCRLCDFQSCKSILHKIRLIRLFICFFFCFRSRTLCSWCSLAIFYW